MRTVRTLAAVALLSLTASGLAAPASAVAPVKKKSGGTAVVAVGEGCSARLIGPGKQETSYKVPANGKLKGLKPGKYQVKAKPKSCKPVPKKVKVKKGKRVTAEVLSDPKLVPTTLSGSFSGQQAGGALTASWTGQITLEITSVGTASFPAFPQLAQYRVTDVSGSWTISGQVPGGCSYSGSGQLARDDFESLSGGNFWINPWNNYTYAFESIANPDRTWPYTATCPDVRNQTLPVPFRLLATNSWSGIDPVAPLPTGANNGPAGSYNWSSLRTSWTWDLDVDMSKEYGKP